MVQNLLILKYRKHVHRWNFLIIHFPTYCFVLANQKNN